MPAPFVDGWTFEAPVVEMPVYLRWLASRLEELGGTLTRMALQALPDGNGAEVVVDATGLGARRMASDTSVLPVRGQVVLLDQVGLDRWWLDSAGPVYVVPRSRDIVAGGTDEEGEWDRRPDPDLAKQILERATDLVPELAAAKVVGHRVGLRPARPTVRLEEERHGTTRVVHCYGHGGAGVTLSWGCADEVAALVSA
jgi:D-amino-acid oxidase